jgi:electron transfer flavoprotein alpha subunit
VNPTVWAWVEGDPEVMGDAADLAAGLGTAAGAIAAGAEPAALAAAGAEIVAVLEGGHDAEAHAAALSAWLEAPAAVLLPGSAIGADLAPRLAARLGAACLMDCAWLRAGPAGIEAARWAHDDRALERWDVPAGTPLVATVRPGARGAARRRRGRGEVVRVPAPSASSRSRRLRHVPPDPRAVRLAEAERIVAAGLGIGSRDALEGIQELADLLGAALGASRPLADRGWVPFERQIGTTGQQVAPRLYVAIGISGAAQHLAGIMSADTIVAVNSDPACPMMVRADLAAAGDAGEVVDALRARLRERAAAPARP